MIGSDPRRVPEIDNSEAGDAGRRTAPAADPALARLLDQATAHILGERLAEAETILRSALALMPGHAGALQQLGVVAYRMGRAAEALALLQRAVAVAPGYADAHFNLGNIHLQEGRFAEAESSLRRAVAAAPRHRDALMNLAGAQFRLGRLGEALATARRVLEIDPGHVATHCLVGRLLRDLGEPVGALHHYRQALALRPGHAEAQRALGAILLEQGQIVPAATELRKALLATPDDARLRALKERAYTQILPGWHFPMLNDSARNEAFERAIRKAVPGKRLVLDIGAGSGLLALMAARAGAERVVACEMIEPLAEAASRNVAANGYGDRIAVVARRSLELKVGRDLPEPADLVIAEILDVGLLGEGIVWILRDALARLTAPGAVVIPAAATVHAMLIECPAWRRVNPIREICGFDLGAMNAFRPLSQPRTIDLDHTPHRPLSTPAAVARVDFARPPAGPVEHEVRLTATADGVAQGVAFWFDLHLDEEVAITTAPGTLLNHWRQSVLFFEEDVPLRKGQPVVLDIGHDDGRFRFRVKPASGGT